MLVFCQTGPSTLNDNPCEPDFNNKVGQQDIFGRPIHKYLDYCQTKWLFKFSDLFPKCRNQYVMVPHNCRRK